MHIFRCFLLLALLSAVTACGLLKKKIKPCGHGHRHIGHPHRRHHHGKCYKRDKNSEYSLGALGFLSWGIHEKHKIVRHIFGLYSHKKVATKLDDGLELCLNVSRGIAVLLNQFVRGLGDYFQRLIMGSIRYIFCVLGKPWQGGSFFDRFLKKKTAAPCVCQKNFGIKWGWRKYSKGYVSFDEIDEFYRLRDAKSEIEKLISDSGIVINKLTGTKKLIIDTIIKISILVRRHPDDWCRNDFILICRYMITCVAAFGRTYKEGTGYAIVEEMIAYFNVALKKANFDQDLTKYEVIIKEELKICDRDSFNGVIVIESESNDNDNKDNNNDNSNDNNNDNNNESDNSNDSKVKKGSKKVTTIKTTVDSAASGSGSASSNSNSENQSEAEADASASASATTTVTYEEWDVWYNDKGEVINSTRTDTN